MKADPLQEQTLAAVRMTHELLTTMALPRTVDAKTLERVLGGLAELHALQPGQHCTFVTADAVRAGLLPRKQSTGFGQAMGAVVSDSAGFFLGWRIVQIDLKSNRGWQWQLHRLW